MTDLPISTLLDHVCRMAKLPIDGVSIGRNEDRSTWHIEYRRDATEAQRQEGAQLLATFDPTEAGMIAAVQAAQVRERLRDPVLHALVQALYEAIPAATLTLDAVQARMTALYTATIQTTQPVDPTISVRSR